MKKCLSFNIIDFSALILGAMLTLAFAPYDIYPFAILAPSGLLLLWLHTSSARAFWRGFLFGLGFFGTGVYWIFISIHFFGDAPSTIAFFFTALLIMALACFPAATGFFTNRFSCLTPAAKHLYAFPAIWVLSEWVRSWLLTGFPWLFLGYSQTDTPLKGYAPLFSVYGVSLAVLMSSVLIVNAALYFKQKKYQSGYLCFFAVTAIWVLGGLLNLIPWTKPNGQPIAVSLVQGNIAQSIKWAPDHLSLSYRQYDQLTAPLWQKNRFIIWPETAIPASVQDAAAFIQKMDDKAKASGAHLIFGVPIETPAGENYYNAIATLGTEQEVYLKRQLVPFGEYLPAPAVFKRLFDWLNIPISEIKPGRFSQDALTLNGTKILPSICYEIAYPQLINTLDKSIGLLLTVTNDAWYGQSSAQAQHLQIAQMRAIEMRRPLLFVSNDGITAIINNDGKIDSSAPAHESFVLNGRVQPVFGLTPWMRNGMAPIFLVLIYLLIKARRLKQKTSTRL